MMKRAVRVLGNRFGLRIAPPAALAAAELGADWYDRDYATTGKYHAPYYQSYYYFLWSVIVDRALRGGHRRVLEIGCGAGRLAAYLYDQGIEDYVGLDFSKAAIAIARQHVPHGRFVVGDARDPAIYRESDYDLIICTEVLEHVEDDLRIVGHFREGVRCLCSVPSFPFESHVRCFPDAAAVTERYGPFFEGLSVMTFRSPNAVEDRFFLMDGVRNGHRV